MSRRAPIPDLYHQLGDVYILHLDPPYKHAAHYSGFSPENSEGVQGRVAEHAAGGPAAARLMQVQHEAGGTFRVGRVWRGVTREREVPEVVRLVDQLIAGWTTPKAPEPEMEAGA